VELDQPGFGPDRTVARDNDGVVSDSGHIGFCGANSAIDAAAG
jgi:hypothetical protein